VPKAKWRPSFRAESSCKDCVCLHKTKNSLRRPALRLCAMSLVHFPLRTPSWTRPRHRLLLRGWGEGPVCSCVVGNEKTDARRDKPRPSMHERNLKGRLPPVAVACLAASHGDEDNRSTVVAYLRGKTRLGLGSYVDHGWALRGICNGIVRTNPLLISTLWNHNGRKETHTRS
jgi:hypothetical protein